MICKICGCDSQEIFNKTILKKYNIQYFKCNNCDFIQTEKEYWLEEAYSNSINSTDIGYMQRNIFYSKRLLILLHFVFKKNSKFLDYAGGYGVFVRLMRDNGFDFFWDDKFTQNLFAKGFESKNQANFDAVTLFEVFEHFDNPIKEIDAILKLTDTIIFSTEIYPKIIPENWWYLGLDHGQHIALYSKKTFQYVSELFNLNYYKIGSLHIFSRTHISFWKLKAMSLERLGLDIIIKKRLKSKTYSDYNYIKNL
jgi:hypothetical protein